VESTSGGSKGLRSRSFPPYFDAILDFIKKVKKGEPLDQEKIRVESTSSSSGSSQQHVRASPGFSVWRTVLKMGDEAFESWRVANCSRSLYPVSTSNLGTRNLGGEEIGRAVGGKGREVRRGSAHHFGFVRKHLWLPPDHLCLRTARTLLSQSSNQRVF
jgi:hypothetical protein